MNFRINKINEEVKRELISILREIKDPRIPEFISVVGVDIAADLKTGKIYVSSLDNSDMDKAIEGLKCANGFIKREIGNRLLLRNVPQFTYIKDNSIEYGSKISRIIDDVIKHDEENTNSEEE